ncbi:hypothetical protein EO93_04105 [Methanosarcina sp. 1.H.A.2.2]|nr:hypothetical protein EO93_04105 [Methanosarcina sp. 1.H.A.2.2]
MQKSFSDTLRCNFTQTCENQQKKLGYGKKSWKLSMSTWKTETFPQTGPAPAKTPQACPGSFQIQG